MVISSCKHDAACTIFNKQDNLKETMAKAHIMGGKEISRVSLMEDETFLFTPQEKDCQYKNIVHLQRIHLL